MPNLTPSSSGRCNRIWICAWRKPGCGKPGPCGKGARPISCRRSTRRAPLPGQRQSQNQPLIGALPLPPNFPFEYSVYQAGFDASWEIDLFGGKRRALEAATAEWEGAIEARNDAMVSLLAEVARNYVELRGGQRRLEIARATSNCRRKLWNSPAPAFKAGSRTNWTSRGRPRCLRACGRRFRHSKPPCGEPCMA